MRHWEPRGLRSTFPMMKTHCLTLLRHKNGRKYFKENRNQNLLCTCIIWLLKCAIFGRTANNYIGILKTNSLSKLQDYVSHFVSRNPNISTNRRKLASRIVWQKAEEWVVWFLSFCWAIGLHTGKSVAGGGGRARFESQPNTNWPLPHRVSGSSCAGNKNNTSITELLGRSKWDEIFKLFGT